MFKVAYIFTFVSMLISRNTAAQRSADYIIYHRQILKADQDMVSGHYRQALEVMDRVFTTYDFVFLRDYQVAAQLAAYIGDRPKAFQYLNLAAADGWSMKAISKISLFFKLHEDPAWKQFERQYPALHRQYLQRLDVSLRGQLKEMFTHDQQLAAENLKITNEKAQDDFVMHRFVPQNEHQVRQLYEILVKKGYPGEKRIGNTLWAWTILCHHNSVSSAYIKQDKLYPALRPLLLKAIASGELSPGDFAVIEDWCITVGSDHQKSAYGYLGILKQNELSESDRLRSAIGLPSVGLRNQLVDFQHRTGIDLYLEGTMWVKGKMPVQKN